LTSSFAPGELVPIPSPVLVRRICSEPAILNPSGATAVVPKYAKPLLLSQTKLAFVVPAVAKFKMEKPLALFMVFVPPLFVRVVPSNVSADPVVSTLEPLAYTTPFAVAPVNVTVLEVVSVVKAPVLAVVAPIAIPLMPVELNVPMLVPLILQPNADAVKSSGRYADPVRLYEKMIGLEPPPSSRPLPEAGGEPNAVSCKRPPPVIAVKAPVVGVVAPTVPLILMEAVPVRFVTVPEEGVPRAPLNTTGAPAEPMLTARAVATPVPKPATPVEMGKPVALVSVAEVGVPRIGVTKVGLVFSTTEPVPVDVVTPVPPDRTGSAEPSVMAVKWVALSITSVALQYRIMVLPLGTDIPVPAVVFTVTAKPPVLRLRTM